MYTFASHLMLAAGGVTGVALLVLAVLLARQIPINAAFEKAAKRAANEGGGELRRHAVQNHSWLTARMPSAYGPALRVRREGLLDRAAEGSGFEGSVDLGDPQWSAAFHVECDDEAFARLLLGDPSRRDAVTTLFNLGFDTFDLDGCSAAATWHGYSRAPKCDDPAQYGAEFGQKTVAALAALRVPASWTPPPSAPADAAASPYAVAADMPAGVSQNAFQIRAGVIIAAAVLGLVLIDALSNLGRLSPIDPWSAFTASLRLSAPLGVLGLAFALGKIRGRTWFLTAAGYAAVAALLGAPVLGYCALIAGNAVLDRGPVSRFEVPVSGVFTGIGRHGGRNYTAVIDFIRPGVGGVTLRLDSATYVRLKPDRSRLRLATRPGRFGWEWVVAKEFVP